MTENENNAQSLSCGQIFAKWFCCRDDEDFQKEEYFETGKQNYEIPVVTSSSGRMLPGYLNRLIYKAETETDCNTNSDSALSDSENFKRKKNGSLGGKSISSEGNSECDSGVGSNRSNKSDSDKSDNENPSKLEDGITYEQIKAHYSKSMKSSKPKRSESTLSRFSSIFKSDGKKLTDVMVDEFKLNDRFSGLSMDRIWGSFMNDIKEDMRQQTGNSLDTIAEIDTDAPDQAAAAHATKTQKRRKRRQRKQMPTQSSSASSWQSDLPADWQNVITL